MKLGLLSLALPLSVVVATPCIYPSSDACGDDQYCAIEDGKCALRIAMQSGTCAPMGTNACTYILAPVCGCDLNTYDSACLAAAAGVNVMTDGPCDDAPAVAPAVAQECTYPADGGCGDDQYCAIEVGKCALKSMQSGTCASKGTRACPMILAPVCGCDRNTYLNDCTAGAAGVNVIAEGTCPSAFTSASADTPPSADTPSSADTPPSADTPSSADTPPGADTPPAQLRGAKMAE